jgi:magnesium-transporting ATPase (P-type)
MVFESGRKARAETPRQVTKYAHFLELVKKEKESPRIIEKEVKKAYQNGDLGKNEFFSLMKRLKDKQSETSEKQEVKKTAKPKDKLAHYDKLDKEKEKEKKEKEKEREKVFDYGISESEREKERYGREEPNQIGVDHKVGSFTKLFSNSNMRLGFFVVAIFALLFFVTKDVLSSKGNGELLIFAIVILGLLFILGSSGSKHDSRDHL